jgi:hypothetical protein
MSKNWTGKLRNAESKGARILASSGLYRDEPVVWQPRYQYDRHPWVVARLRDKALTPDQEKRARFTGKECRPVFPDREVRNG